MLGAAFPVYEMHIQNRIVLFKFDCIIYDFSKGSHDNAQQESVSSQLIRCSGRFIHTIGERN